MTRVPGLVQAWRAADAAARAAEKEVLSASRKALDGRGSPPAREQLENASRLRKTADRLLRRALNELERERGSG